MVRPPYTRRACESQGHDPRITRASLPPEPISRSGIGSRLLAHVIVSKIVDHLPLHCQEGVLARHGWDVRRSTLCDHLRTSGEVAFLAQCRGFVHADAYDGAKGPRVSDWAVVRTNSPDPDEYARWVLIRRSVSDPAEVAYFACGGPPATTVQQLVLVAGARWAIEDLFELAKGDCGLDEYEVRSWTGWHRHVTLSLWALAVVAVIRSRLPAPRRKKGARG